MRAVIQRVSEASVIISGIEKCKIGSGLLVLLGIEELDGKEDILWLAKKIPDLRIFSDNQGLMNLSVRDIKGGIIVVSQFTLHAATKKGNRPSFIKAAKPEKALEVYENFQLKLKNDFGNVKSGEFGADMKVQLVNDGPVTIYIDTKVKE
jgi:D-aminoacyl-tRNA deacylase